MTHRATIPDPARPAPATESSAATLDVLSTIDASSDWTTLDELAFDSSLSFLDDVESNPGIPEPIPVPLVFPESDEDDMVTAALLQDMLALADNNGVAVGPTKPTERDAPSQLASSPSESTTLTPPPTKTKSASNRSRQKEEIEYLRVQVMELENELATMKQRTEGNDTTPSVWENIAKRQSDEKHKAEIENIKLRELVEGQLRVAKSLEKLLRKRVLNQDEALFVERKRPRALSSPLDLEDGAKEIHMRILNQFDDVDAVIKESGLTNVTTDFEDSRATSDAANAICMEMTMVKTFPFEFTEVAEAVWQCTSATHIPLANGYYGGTQRSDSLADLKFAVKLRVRRSEATIHVRGVGARRTMADRCLIVFESNGATVGPLFSGQGINCRERGYIVVEKAATSTSSTPSTITRVCVRMWPEVEGHETVAEGSQHFPQAGLFVDLVVGSYNNNVATMLQVIENVLLSRSIQRTCHDTS